MVKMVIFQLGYLFGKCVVVGSIVGSDATKAIEYLEILESVNEHFSKVLSSV